LNFGDVLYTRSMPAPILATKLYLPPPRPKAVLRPRLIERLNEAISAGRRLTLISAPAGFGKTSLVSEWVATITFTPSPAGREGGVRAAWLSLDEGDHDLTRFLTYFIAALQTLPTSAGGANFGAGILDVLHSPQPPPTEALLTALLNEIAAVTDKFVLILDDYHAVDSRAVDHALAFMLEHLPSQMHLVIATREDPHLPLARLRARGQLTELRAADLRFTPAEAAEFLNQVMGLNLKDADIAALETRTEGWIAGLQLAGISMQDREDIPGFIQAFTGSHRFVLDYLVEEVLQRQPDDIHSFLLKTAILDRLSGSLCNAVTGREDGGHQDGKGMLETLERGNLFIIPLDDQRLWYRYHPLFAEVLQARLLGEQPDQVFSLHKRASEWYEHNGSAPDAIHHALAAKDYERAAILVELAIPEMRRNRQEAARTELGWLKALPDELVHFRPVLSVAYAYALFGGGELEAVEARLRDAERWLDTTVDTAGMVVVDEEEFRRLPGMIALLRAAQALARGDMPEAVKNARRVLDLTPQDAHLMLGGAASVLGLAAWASGDLEAARGMTADGMANVRLAGYISSAIGGSIVLADIQIAQGRLDEAMTTYERGLQWATEPGAPIQRGAADMHVGMSNLHYEHNDLKTATQHLLTSQALGELAGLPPNPYRWRAAMARIRVAQGDLDEALVLLDQAERLYDAAFAPNVRPIATRKVQVWVAQGRLGEALGWARERGLSVENELSYLHEFDHITLARVLLARYRSDRADGSISEVVGLLERLLKAAEEGERVGSVIEILVLQAIAYHAQGDLPAALLTLQRALMLAEPQGNVRIFLDEGEPMRLLFLDFRLWIEKQSRDQFHALSGYVDRLLAAFAPPAAPSAAPTADIPQSKTSNLNSTLVEPLSQREIKILRLIAQGLSNREIGKRLFLALDTIKGHNRKIFDKLQVQSRTEAIARARELGLL
jgi:LuxR family maltose regulon positive regulatory protein